MAQFPGFSPPASDNDDVGMTDADVEESSADIEHNSAVSRTAERFGTALRISRPKLSIPNPMRNYFAISSIVDPTFSAPGLELDAPMAASSSSMSENNGPPAVLPMTPVYVPPPAPQSIRMTAPIQPEVYPAAQAVPPAASQGDTPRPKPSARNKVPLEKGYSQMVWLRLMQTEPDLAGLKGESPRRLLSMDEIKLHKSENEAWTILRGRVYNISPYLKFHPGGVDMLMKAAGKDGTALFNKYHAWVNAEFLMEKCLVGILDVQAQGHK